METTIFENNGSFTGLTILILLIVLLIFAMKYGTQMFRAKADATQGGETELRFKTLEDKSQGLEERVAKIEALLKEVE